MGISFERRYSRIRGRRLTTSEALLERFAMSAAGYRYLLHLAPRIDRVLIPWTDGRWSSTGRDKVGLLATTGARSGLPRRQPVSVMPHEGGVVVAASNYGRDTHPAWSANLRADPGCTLTFDGTTRRCHAVELDGHARREAWSDIVDFYRGYDVYAQRCAPRRIRVFRIDPAA